MPAATPAQIAILSKPPLAAPPPSSPAGPVNVLSANAGSLTGTVSKTFTTTAAIPAGAKAIFSLLTHGDQPISISDTSGQTWNPTTDQQISNLDLSVFKCDVGGSGIPSGATITVTWSFANQTTAAAALDYFTGFSSFPGTNDGGGAGGSGGETTSVTGPTVAGSYQFFVQTYSVVGANGPDGGTTAGWNFWQATTSDDYAMKSYYNTSPSTGGTVVVTSPGGFSIYANLWIEVKI